MKNGVAVGNDNQQFAAFIPPKDRGKDGETYVNIRTLEFGPGGYKGVPLDKLSHFVMISNFSGDKTKYDSIEWKDRTKNKTLQIKYIHDLTTNGARHEIVSPAP